MRYLRPAITKLPPMDNMPGRTSLPYGRQIGQHPTFLKQAHNDVHEHTLYKDIAQAEMPSVI